VPLDLQDDPTYVEGFLHWEITASHHFASWAVALEQTRVEEDVAYSACYCLSFKEKVLEVEAVCLPPTPAPPTSTTEEDKDQGAAIEALALD
jgi:hypothetical protein